MAADLTIGGRPIGPEHPPFIVAELSGNHRGEIERAIALIDAAKAAGADAVKLQTYTADTITIDHDGPEFRIASGTWAGSRLYDLYRLAHTPWDWHERLFDHARSIGIAIFSTPFDASAIAFLERLRPPAYKIASFELVDPALIGGVARTGKPLIMSTGMASLEEIDAAVGWAAAAGCARPVLLHCISGYPTPAADANLRVIPALAARYGLPSGLSDHTLGTSVAVAAVALGACVIEKHITLCRAEGGPDASFSLEPAEFAELCSTCRSAWEALGEVSGARPGSEAASVLLRRSLFVVADVAAGDVFTAANIRSIRPGQGLPPRYLPDILNRCAARSLRRGTPLAWDMIAAASGG